MHEAGKWLLAVVFLAPFLGCALVPNSNAQAQREAELAGRVYDGSGFTPRNHRLTLHKDHRFTYVTSISGGCFGSCGEETVTGTWSLHDNRVDLKYDAPGKSSDFPDYADVVALDGKLQLVPHSSWTGE